MEQKFLYMVFKNSLGNSCTISVEDPRDDLTEQEIVDCMNLIITKNIFEPKGYDLTTAVSAKVVASDITEYDLVI